MKVVEGEKTESICTGGDSSGASAGGQLATTGGGALSAGYGCYKSVDKACNGGQMAEKNNYLMAESVCNDGSSKSAPKRASTSATKNAQLAGRSVVLPTPAAPSVVHDGQRNHALSCSSSQTSVLLVPSPVSPGVTASITALPVNKRSFANSSGCKDSSFDALDAKTRRMIKNRESAQLWREKKKKSVEAMEAANKQLLEDKDALQERVRILEEGNKKLEEQISSLQQSLHSMTAYFASVVATASLAEDSPVCSSSISGGGDDGEGGATISGSCMDPKWPVGRGRESSVFSTPAAGVAMFKEQRNCGADGVYLTLPDETLFGALDGMHNSSSSKTKIIESREARPDSENVHNCTDGSLGKPAVEASVGDSGLLSGSGLDMQFIPDLCAENLFIESFLFSEMLCA